jgi:aldose 1-epimerase
VTGGEPFGTTKAGQARLFTLRAGGTEVRVTDYGGRIVSVVHEGSPNLVLSLSGASAYEADEGYLGAIVGRTANRVGHGRTSLDGRALFLAPNEGPHHLHGGPDGFSWRVWTVEEAGEDRLALSLVSEDGDQGYPGCVKVTTSFHVKPGRLRLDFRAEANAPTPLALTQHAYWNLGGTSDALGHELACNADRMTPVGKGKLFTGEVRGVGGTPFDLRSPRVVGEVDREVGGLDHDFVAPDGQGATARLRDPASGRTLDVTSDAPCVQLYAGGMLKAPHAPNEGIAIEPQDWPDSLNHDAFANAVLRPGSCYERWIEFAFE